MRRNRLVEAAVLCAVVGAGFPAYARYYYEVRNSCHLPIQLAVHYQDFRSGDWKTGAWWTFSAGEESRLATGGRLIRSNNQNYYYYAELQDNDDYSWSGGDDSRSEKRRVGDRVLSFRRRVDRVGNNHLELTCDGMGSARRVYVYNDCDAHVRLGLRHERRNGEWATWYYHFVPGEAAYVNAVTSNRRFSYYARSTDGSELTWRGARSDDAPLFRRFDSTRVQFRRAEFGRTEDAWGTPEKEGHFKYVLRCDEHTTGSIASAAQNAVDSGTTEVRVIYRSFMQATVPNLWYGLPYLDYQRYPHSMLVAVHPEDPLDKSVYIDAGPARGEGSEAKKKSRGCPVRGQLCGEVRNAAFIFDSPAYDNFQSFRVDRPFHEVVEIMSEYTERVNSRAVAYNLVAMNCNSFVFTFARNWLNVRDLTPSPYDPGEDILPVGWRENVPGV